MDKKRILIVEDDIDSSALDINLTRKGFRPARFDGVEGLKSGSFALTWSY